MYPAVNGYRPVEERNDAPEAPLQNSANKTAQLVCKVFTAMALLGAGATLYTAFWFTAVPSTVIAAFNTSLTTTLVSAVIAFIARQMSANNAQPRVVNQYQPAPQPAANALPETCRPSAPKLVHQDTSAHSAPPQPKAPVQDTTPTSAPSAPVVAVREEPAEGSAEAEYLRAKKVYDERCAKIEAEYDDRIQAVQHTYNNALARIAPMKTLIDNHEKAKRIRSRLCATIPPKQEEIAQTKSEKSALKKEIALKETELSKLETHLAKAQKLYQKRQECQGLNREAIQKEIAGCETQIAEAQKLVTGIRAAWGSNSKEIEVKKRLQVLQGQLDSLDEAQGVDPQALQKELDSLPEKIERLKLEISPMKRRQTTLGYKLQGYERQQADYDKFLKADVKKQTTLEEIESFKSAHEIFGDLNAFYEQAKETADARFLQAKADLTAWREFALAAEHKPLRPLNASID
jgi:hypothetical protein